MRNENCSPQTASFLEKCRHFSYVLSVYVQYFVTFTIIVAIGISLLSLPKQWGLLTDVDSDSLIGFLRYIINIIIAVELIRVLCHQTLDTIVEILLIAITRELIIEHLSTWELLVGVLAVGVLFLIRKYLFVSQLDKQSRPDMPRTHTHQHPAAKTMVFSDTASDSAASASATPVASAPSSEKETDGVPLSGVAPAPDSHSAHANDQSV